MSNHRLEFGLIRLTTLLVFTIGMGLYFNLMSFRPEAGAEEKLNRTPTAVTETQAESLPEPIKKSSFETPCVMDGQTYHMNVHLKRARIESKLCEKKHRIKDSLIVNKTNGFVATSFILSPKKLTTDLVELNVGENHIHMAIEMESGEKIQAQVVMVMNSTGASSAPQ